MIEERVRELNRIQTVLDGCNLKLSSVLTDVSGKSGIAISHSMMVAIYHILKDLQPYKELGCSYYDTCNHVKIIQRNVRSLERLGVKVVIE